MYCEPCRVERLGTARFCVICGSKLIERPREEVEADLARVRWLLEELVEWAATHRDAEAARLLATLQDREKSLADQISRVVAD